MPDLPPCRSLGRHCQELDVVLKVADLDADTRAEQDALATWLTGHTERISFGRMFQEGRALLASAVIRVPCKYLAQGGSQCLAHGFTGSTLRPRPRPAPPLRRGPDRFLVADGSERRVFALKARPLPERSLPVLATDNPCVGAPCRTADNAQGAACCRDLTIDVVLEGNQPGLLELLRSRQAPYLCKVTPDGTGMAECEVISACGYLEHDGVTCGLHDRMRPDGEPAKPFVCSEWPELEEDQVGHPGCRLV